MRSLNEVLKDIEIYLDNRKREGEDLDYLERRAHFSTVKRLYANKDYTALQAHLAEGIKKFKRYTPFKQKYLGYLNELQPYFICSDPKEKKDRLFSLFRAIYSQDNSQIDDVLQRGGIAVINEPYPVATSMIREKETPLQAALKTKNKAILIKILLEARGNNLSVEDIQQQISLGLILGSKEEPIDVPLSDNSTLLHLAAEYGLTDLVEELIPKADLEKTNKEGRTALELACIQNREEIAVLLLEAGAEPNLDSRSGVKGSALAAAVSSKNTKLVHELINHGAKIDEIAYKMAKKAKKEIPEIYDLLKRDFHHKKQSILNSPETTRKYIVANLEKIPPAIQLLAKQMYFENPSDIPKYIDGLSKLYIESSHLRPIIDMLALGSTGVRKTSTKPLKIVISAQDTLSELLPSGEIGMGAYRGKNTLYMTSGFSNYSLGIFLHESKHYTDKELFNHIYNGFPTIHIATFQKIYEEIETNRSKILANNPTGINNVIATSFDSVFTEYNLKARRGELMARVSEVLGALGQKEGRAWLEANVPKLLMFYENYFLPVVNSYLIKAGASEILNNENISDNRLF